MKIKRIYTHSAIQSKGYVRSFDSSMYQLEFNYDLNGFFVDKTTFIPSNNVMEVIVEPIAIDKSKVVPKQKDLI